MSGGILNYTLKLTVLGPLFIGSGETLDKCDYVFYGRDKNSRGTVSVIDFEKMTADPKGRDISEALMERFRLDGSENVILSEFFEKYKPKIEYKDYKPWIKYSYDTQPGDRVKNQIATIIKDSYGLPYVPGSSVKGALRNAVLNSVLLNSNEYGKIADSVAKERFDPRHSKQYLSDAANEIDIKAFHTRKRPDTDPKDMVNSIFSGLRIGDSKPIPIKQLTLCKKIDVFPKGASKSSCELPIYRECIKPETVIEFPVEIDTEIFKLKIDSGEIKLDAQAICKCIRDMYDMEAKRFYYKFPDFEKEKGTVLYIGGGSGFLSKTAVYSLYKDPKKALDVASVILDNVDSKMFGVKIGKHLNDPRKYGVSPHTWKCTDYDGCEYDFGLCEVECIPIK